VASLYETAAPKPAAERLVEVHDGMIAKLAEARRAIEAGDIEQRFVASRQAGDVIDVLYISLDMENGGDVAHNLRRLYAYFNRRLIELNSKNDPAICDELAARLRELRDAWDAIARPASPAASPLGTAVSA
jgi:flagellar protein FliS